MRNILLWLDKTLRSICDNVFETAIMQKIKFAGMY